MRIVSILHLKLRSLFSRGEVEQELDEELRYHLERQIDENVAAGMEAEEARYAALQSIRDIEQRKEDCREARGLNVIDNVVQDVRYAIRQFRKNPGFAGTAVFVLALGVSAAISMFGFVDAALIRPLPYRDQDRLVTVFESSSVDTRLPVSYLDFADWKRLNSVFNSIGAYALNGSFTLSTRIGAQQVTGTRVSAGFFHTLGITPILGRDFRGGEDSPDAAHTAVLSYDGWKNRFAGSRDVLGQTVTLNGNPTTIIGVLPRDFHFALYGDAEFWATLRGSEYECERERGCHNLNVIARLKPGVSIAAGSANMQSIARELQKRYPDSNRDLSGVNLVSLRDLIIGDVRPILLVLLSGAGLLLLIACVNVAALVLARREKREREIAVRSALGASSSRLFHQFAIEGFVLACLGSGLGLLLAEEARSFLLSLIPAEKMETMPYLRGLRLDSMTILVTCCICVFAAMLFAFIPIARTPVSEMMEGLKNGARGSAGRAWRRFGSNLVIAEIAIAMMLMVGAGLLAKSLYLLLHAGLGFNAEHLALVQTSWAPGRYASNEQKTALEHEIVDRISRVPGVKSIAISIAPPIDSAWPGTSVHVVGRPNPGENNEVLDRRVSAAYFLTLQARLLRGRYFTEKEDASKPGVAVINQTFANKYFPSENPIGQQIYYGSQPKSPMQIIGIVTDIKEGPLEGADMPVLYVPYDQRPVAWPAVLVRTAQHEAALLPAITRAIQKVDPFISVSVQETMMERINQSPAAYLHRSSALVVGGFAGAALLLSVAGLYGVIAYSASQRIREIGIRMALGAERAAVYRLVLGEAGRLTALGVVLGIAGSLAVTTLMRTLLFGVRSWDLPTLAAVAAALGISALVASYIPARRAASVNPIEALRSE